MKNFLNNRASFNSKEFLRILKKTASQTSKTANSKILFSRRTCTLYTTQKNNCKFAVKSVSHYCIILANKNLLNLSFCKLQNELNKLQKNLMEILRDPRNITHVQISWKDIKIAKVRN